MIIGSVDVENGKYANKEWGSTNDYAIVRVDFSVREMKKLERLAGIKKADMTSWISFFVQVTDDGQDCEIKAINHFTMNEIHNGKQGYSYDIPSIIFSDDAISTVLDAASEALGLDTVPFEIENAEWREEFDVPKEYQKHNPVVVE